MTARVSVIVPVRNRRELLVECLAGLAGQTYRDFEVIVVDDGSTDGSPLAVKEAASAGLPARAVPNPDRGAVSARRAGAALAAGEILAFTDSDCIPQPGWLAAVVDAVDGGATVVQGRTEPVRPCRRDERSMVVLEADHRYPTCNVAYRRDAYDRAGGFDDHLGEKLGFRPGSPIALLGFGEDTELAWRVLRGGGTAVFRSDAVVRHAVFAFDRRESIRRAWMGWAFPALLRQVPELGGLLRWGVVYGSIDKLPLYGAAVAAGLRRPRPAVVFVAAWVGLTTRRLLKLGTPLAEVPRTLPDSLAIDAVHAAGLVGGSVRARRLVL